MPMHSAYKSEFHIYKREIGDIVLQKYKYVCSWKLYREIAHLRALFQYFRDQVSHAIISRVIGNAGIFSFL